MTLNMEIYQEENLTLHNTDCLKLLATLDDNSIDLIATDPPYYNVKTEKWDRQWKNKQAFFDWLETVLAELHRVLKPNGSLYFFAGPHLATEVECLVKRHFNLLNHIIWCKPSGRWNGCNKESLRKYFPQTEHIMFGSSKKKIEFVYEPIRAYLDQFRLAAGLSQAQVDKACGCQMAGHWFSSHQWSFPSKAHYQTMENLFKAKLKPYEQLKAEYKAIKQKRRVFNVSKHVPYTNVWHFKTVTYYEGKHPCEKPLDLMTHIITASSLPGSTVLDIFAGSGKTAIACKQTDRVFIGCDFGKKEFLGAVERIKQ
jgi:adenine-specific DNA-methyltransferase